MNVTTVMNRVVKKYLEKIKPIQRRIKGVWLFGSRARGDYLPDSDYDLLVIVDKRSKKNLDVIYTAAVDLLMEDLADISVKVIPYEVYEKLVNWKTPFMVNVLKEGIRLV